MAHSGNNLGRLGYNKINTCTVGVILVSELITGATETSTNSLLGKLVGVEVPKGSKF